MEGVFFFGDCNARHLYWGDQKCNALGNELVSLVPTYTILNDSQPTFLSINGQSVIDLCICKGNFINQYKCLLTFDEDTELFAGAPSRGHLPVLVSLVESKSGYFKEKPWVEKALWDDWRAHLETEMLDWKTSDNALEMWEFFKNSLREATLLFIPFKNVTQHSKAFWCPELTIASKELKQLRRNFRYKTNHANLEKLAKAKELFKRLLSEKASAWMKNYLKALGHKQGKEFWVSYKKLFAGSRSSSKVDLIKNKHGKLLLSKKDIAQGFQETFFEGKHLETLNFDESMSRTVSGYLDSFDDASEHVSEVFHEPFTMEELNDALKQSFVTSSFDPDEFHVKMIKTWESMRRLFSWRFLTHVGNKLHGPGLYDELCLSGSLTNTGMTTVPAIDRYLSLVILESFLSVCCAID